MKIGKISGERFGLEEKKQTKTEISYHVLVYTSFVKLRTCHAAPVWTGFVVFRRCLYAELVGVGGVYSSVGLVDGCGGRDELLSMAPT